MIEVRLASAPVPGGGPNEDCGFAVPGLVGVLDGVTVLAGMDTGCVHGPAWYSRTLADRLVRAHTDDPGCGLADLLSVAIAEVRDAHGGECDLTHPGTPASTACLARYDGDRLEYLVLGDSPLVHDCGGQVEVVTDLRVQRVGRALRAAMPAEVENAVVGSPEYAEGARRRVAAQREYINRPDGYWIASNEPEAARHALTGTLPLAGPDAVRRVCLLTDGASRAVDTFGLYGWSELLDEVDGRGPAHLIAAVRAAEYQQDQTRLKRHDDATAALIRFPGPQ